MSSNSRLVYSTGGSNTCPHCGKALRKCQCTNNESSASGDGIVRIHRETSGRGGKQVTVVNGLGGDQARLKSLLKKMKSQCGSGGAQKGGSLEIQGDHRDTLKSFLEKQGFTVKLSGG